MNYDVGETPEYYKCTDCGVTGVKLWREYNTFLDHQTFRCAKCACENQNETYGIDNAGYYTSNYGKSDQIGWLVPAVPTEDDETYWGYTSVPSRGVKWWRELPTYPVVTKTIWSRLLSKIAPR